jgi:hypothetical protein
MSDLSIPRCPDCKRLEYECACVSEEEYDKFLEDEAFDKND